MKILYGVVFATFLGGCSSAREGADSAALRLVNLSMDRRAAELLADPLINSVSIGIYRDGHSFTGHYGELDAGQGNTPNDETVYEIASVTKTFTGTLVAQAVIDGKMSLNDDIRGYLTQDYPHLEYAGEPMRIRHLVTHTSGLPANNKAMEEVPDGNEDGLLWKRLHEAERDYSKDKFFAHLREIRIGAAPGSHFLYSNLATNLMGHILENAYGETYGDLLRQYVFDEAGMVQTKLHLNDGERLRLANGYNEKGTLIPPLPLADVLWGAEGGLKSTLPDMTRYIKFQLAQMNSAVVESHRRLHQLDKGYWVGYYWWVIDVEKDVVSFRHDGGSGGVRNVLIVYPDYDLGIYVVTNKATPGAFSSLTRLTEGLRDDLR